MYFPPVIAVAAPSRRSGKGTISNLLVREFHYTEFSFALPIKTMFIALCIYTEIPKELYPRILDGDLKETPMVGGLSLRSFAEGIGTTWGRNQVDPDLWVKIGDHRIRKMLGRGNRIVISDARFPNECNVARELGGSVINVIRPETYGGLAPTLASEGHLTDYPFDATILNNGTVDDLEQRLREWIVNLEERP